MKHALIVEDLPDIRAWLGEVAISAFPELQVTSAARRDEALRCIQGGRFDLALIDLGLPDGSGLDVVAALRRAQPQALPVVVTIYDDDDHLFPALQAGAFGYLLKEQPRETLVAQLLRMVDGEPPLSPPIARRVLAYFATAAEMRQAAMRQLEEQVHLTDRETEVLQRVAKGYTLPEIAQQFGLSRHTIADYIKQIYRKLNVSSRAEAALEAARRGLVRP
ncbi:response regulator transcription factor [Caenimonas sedimenti]|uniref:Response regulator transcription factor n=1 Tax=Caenimonas sedimenti TaxID=2596921 RepID=A0A562ZE65_9BURK|nr:response regulator transcription factor [Caenimonas sedimenti]TWO65005.1 response regulator transcription factor [Caenimonas sedimenti]